MLAGNAAEPLIALGEWDRASQMIERALDLDPPAHHHAYLRLVRAWLDVWRGTSNKLKRCCTSSGRWSPMFSRRRNICVMRSKQTRSMRSPPVIMNAPGPTPSCSSTTRTCIQHQRSTQCWSRPLRRPRAGRGRTCRPPGRVVRNALAAAKPIGVRRGWQPVIEAALEDTADGWRLAWKASVDDGAPAHLAPYAGLRLAQHLVASRDRSEAREVLASAAELAGKIGAGLLTGRLPPSRSVLASPPSSRPAARARRPDRA